MSVATESPQPHHRRMKSNTSPASSAATCLDNSAYGLGVDRYGEHMNACKTMLASEKLVTVLATVADEAVSAMRTRGAPAVLITDLSLSGRDGFELIREPRIGWPTAATVVIVDVGVAQLQAGEDLQLALARAGHDFARMRGVSARSSQSGH